MRHGSIRAFAVALTLLLAVDASAARKKKKGDDEDVAQTLPVLKDPPGAVSAETGRLVFHVSPLSAKGLLTQQVRDALKVLFKENRGASIVKLRAFAVDSGDLRRVRTLVSEIFTDRKMSLPALSAIQAGALPMDGAQVVLESVAMEKKVVNRNGLAFFSGTQGKDALESIARLETEASAAGVKPANVLRVTCFLSSLDGFANARDTVASVFPGAAADFIQLQRIALEPLAECEAVGRLDSPPAAPVTFLSPLKTADASGYSQIALVNTPKIVFSGTQMAFGEQDADVRLAFDRLQKTLAPLGVSYKNVFWSAAYPLTRPVADRVRNLRFEFLDRSHPPAGTLLLFEGLESLDASAALEVIAAAK
ncbi:MAG: hypothetical protein ACRD30_02880 [Bryobacteraceae bacterium]